MITVLAWWIFGTFMLTVGITAFVWGVIGLILGTDHDPYAAPTTELGQDLSRDTVYIQLST